MTRHSLFRSLCRAILVIACVMGMPLIGGAQSVTFSDYPRHGTDAPSQHQAAMRAFATALAGAALAGHDVEVAIYGHADFDAQGRDFERQVSIQRARAAESALRGFFTQAADLTALSPQLRQRVRFISVGLGTLRPVFPHPANEEERKANRRVEFVATSTPRPAPDPLSKFERCIRVLPGNGPAGPGRRMTCACTKLLQQAPPVKDYYYDFRSAEQARQGAGGLATFTPEQWNAFYKLLVIRLRTQIDQLSPQSDSDFAAGLVSIDDSIGRSINDFMSQTATPAAGNFERVVIADIGTQMQDPNHIYACYAGYSRRNHDQ